MDDLGPPIAYTVLEEGIPVFDIDGKRIGVVEDVVADMQLDIFEGVLIHTRPVPGRYLFADVEQIAELREGGVLLSVPRGELHEPPAERGNKEQDDEDRPGSPLETRLRRAWARLTQRR